MHLREQLGRLLHALDDLDAEGTVGLATAASDAIRGVLVQGEVMLADTRGHLFLRHLRYAPSSAVVYVP